MVRRVSRREFNLGLVGLVGGLAVGCAQTGTPAPAVGQQPSGQPSFPKEIKIGAIYPLTGPAASSGLDGRYGIELAVEIINGKYDLNLPLAREEGLPNLGGAKIQIVWADSQGTPEKGQAEAERLITQEKVVALTGAYHSSVTATASQVAERLGIPYVNFESSSPSLTERGFKWFFRTGPHDATFGKNLFDLLRDMEKKGVKVRTIGIVNENTLYGTDANKITKQYAQEYGYQVVVDIAYPANTSDVTSEVQRIKAANPDVLFQVSYTSDLILFIRTYKQLDYTPQMILGYGAGFVDPQYTKTLGKDADYAITRAAWSADITAKRPAAKVVAEMFQQKFGQPMTENSARSFTGMLVLADAINRAKSLDPEAIRQALLQTDIPGDQTIMPWQGVKFDEKTHQNIYAQGVNLQIIGGQYYTVWPFDLATREIVWPMPKWSQR